MTKWRRWILPVLATFVWGAPAAFAHESRPAYLELTEQNPAVFEVLWRRPMRGERVLALQPVFPGQCASAGMKARYAQPDFLVERWIVDCRKGGLVGQPIGIEGLQATLTDVLVRVAFADGSTHTQVLRPNATTLTVKGSPSKWQVMGDYFRLGVEHILGGADHLLFVLALLILVEGTRQLIATVTAFTLAHSLTLTAATLGWVHVPQQPVEAVIALSIVFVAGEILHARQGRASLTRRLPWVVAFTFGLLHGFGFAGALAEIGLPQKEIPLALMTFNIGVEAGQILFIAVILGLLSLARLMIKNNPRWAVPAAAYGIGGMAAFWLIVRVNGFF